MKRYFIFLSLLVLALQSFAQSKSQPNFIIILCDDLGYGDIDVNGGSIPTPKLSNMAREGLVATNYYSAANLCTPSRAGSTHRKISRSRRAGI